LGRSWKELKDGGRATAEHQTTEIAQLRAAPSTSELNLVALVAALRRAMPVPWREIEGLLGRPQSTVCGWPSAMVSSTRLNGSVTKGAG